MLAGIFQDLYQLFHKSLPGWIKPMSIKLLRKTIGNPLPRRQWIKRPFTGFL
ncbi:hypothetical protein STM14_4943 [Salmonella enterica subsp. enterica serovar Typhimurium str. 14028S]|uniref:Uncharacterized protein n=1 Tax=Salmonella typhimurium (strain 14028s / SGSC 2262) TaxID=588858 RepID=A0A0F6B9U7_SALT1|nr:hypothetical protein STM14_4943 [Salmonella enterica subsp. enterica serovar Typhimurium str. 14028S]